MLRYQVIPYLFNISVIKPLLKDSKKSNDDLNNLRPVAISDVFANIYESILLQELEKQYQDNNKQFGYKPKSSCSHAIFALKQTVALIKNKNRRMYVAAIDASKAFDKVNRDTLWYKMIELKIDPLVINGLKNYYDCSTMIVSNNDEHSTLFKTTIGVRQGGVISPKLFSIYMDKLMSDIESLEHGVSFGDLKVDIIVYADDILLIIETRNGLREQLNCVTEYGKENEIKFNPNKSVFMVFNKSTLNRMEDRWQGPLELAGNRINQVTCMKYLGVEINDKENSLDHIKTIKQKALSCIFK
ncbi:unnamed protein product [Brachionus calyciflorus]|uniref:Reverse transcriptase domain-containing protein n=1 Tax=Brachionus calyciflorus TaxID=104777 RepID=A0A813T0F9_9BILA|nr:unnamed protein product [Brachionus calyciflorus]